MTLCQEGRNGMSLLIPTKVSHRKESLILRVVFNKIQNTEILNFAFFLSPKKCSSFEISVS